MGGKFNCNECVITESIPDAIAFQKVDIPSCALLGKEISQENRPHFERARAKLYFCMDPDKAGRDAAYHLAREYRGYILELGYSKDPDEVLAELGVERFRELADKVVKEARYYLDLVVEKESLQDAMTEILKLDYETDREKQYKKLAEIHGVT
ncbi:MAG: toprim domain-containing protein, partial [Thermodesulfobacteriota bacterium]